MSDQGKTSAPLEDSTGVGIVTDRVPEIKCGKCGCEIDVSDVESFSRVECPDCHAIENVPAKLGPFLLESLIGTGGMGGVFKAKDESLGRFVALKVMLKSVGEKTAFVDYFKREAQAVAKLNHPSIVQIYSFGQEKGQPYIVMELVGGRRFDKMIDESGNLAQSLVMRIGLDVAEGLKAAEDIGLLHGDVKPENILLDERGHAKLVDFGIATFANQGNQDGIWGTPYYVAPEKIKRQKVDHRSDIYSLGATLYHAITKRPPFEGKTPIDVVKARLRRKPRMLSELRSDTDKEVENIIMRMLETEPSRRYPNYSSLIGDLRKLMQTMGDGKRFERDIMKRTGKIFITRRKDGTSGSAQLPTVPPPPKATAAEVKPQVGTKISFKKQKTTISAPISGQTHQTITSDPKATTAGKPGSPDILQASIERRKKSKATTRLITSLVFLIIVTIAAIFGYGRWKEKQKRDRTAKALAWEIADLQSKAREDTQKTALPVTKVSAMIKSAQVYADRATNAVFLATGNRMDMPASKPVDAIEAYRRFTKEKVSPPEAVPEAPKPEKDASNTVAAAQDTTSVTNAPTAKATTNTVAVAPQDDKPAKAPAEQPVKAPATPEPKPVPAQPQQPESEIETAARAILQDAVAVNDLAGAAKELSDYCNVYLVAVTQMNDPAKIGLKNKDIEKLVELATGIESAARATVDRMGPATKKVEELKAKALREKETLHRLDEEKRLQEEADKAKAQKEAEHKTLVENEKKLADTAHQNANDLFKQYKFKEAAGKLLKDLPEYKTEEGKSTLKTYAERFTRLAKFKEYLTKQLNDDPFKWGFGASTASSVDIAGADENGIRLKTRNVAWADISAEQWKRFFKRYLDDVNQPISQRIKGDGKVAASIFYAESGNLQMAAEYAKAAIEAMPSLQGDIKRIMPEVVLKKEE